MNRSLVKLAIAAAICSSPLLQAQAPDQPAPAMSQQQLLQQVQQQRREGRQLNRQREQQFLDARNSRRKLLKDARAELSRLEAAAKKLQQQRQQNEAALAKQRQQLADESAELQAMFAAVNLAAGELYAQTRRSIVSTQFPERAAELEQLATRAEQPDINTIRTLWLRQLEEMTEAARVARYSATVTAVDGSNSVQMVERLGAFGALITATDSNSASAPQYLRYIEPGPGAAGAGQLQIIAGIGAADLLDLWSGKLVEVLGPKLGLDVGSAEKSQADAALAGSQVRVIDPTGGELLAAEAEKPSLLDRIRQGGVVGQVIIVLGVLGLLLALWRWLRLSIAGMGMRRQLKRLEKPGKRNPLGRVLLAAHSASEKQAANHSLETLELKLDEAIMQETPRLERGLSLLKLLAAVAPLLGLLGTVTGMIATFQSITQFGTSDPRLMAGGISQALITTVLGLVVAIPLLFAHALVSGRSRRLVQILDQQSAGLLAGILERRQPQGSGPGPSAGPGADRGTHSSSAIVSENTAATGIAALSAAPQAATAADLPASPPGFLPASAHAQVSAVTPPAAAAVEPAAQPAAQPAVGPATTREVDVGALHDIDDQHRNVPLEPEPGSARPSEEDDDDIPTLRI